MAVSLDYDELVAELERRRSAKFDPPELFAEGIRRLLDEVGRRDLLTREGRRLLQHEVLRIMHQRASLDDLSPARSSEIERTALVITGQPRTSSTLLHNLVADVGAHSWIPLWQALEPFPADDVDRERPARLERATTQLRYVDALSPDLRRLHPMRPDRPEECITLMALTGVSDRFAISLTVPDYRDWTQGPTVMLAAYTEYRAILDLIFSGDARPLVLKAPSHAPHVRLLEAVLPGSEFVWLQRNEDEVESSFARLVAASRAVFQVDSDPTDWRGRWRDLDAPDRCRVIGWEDTAAFAEELATRFGARKPRPADHADWLRPSGSFTMPDGDRSSWTTP